MFELLLVLSTLGKTVEYQQLLLTRYAVQVAQEQGIDDVRFRTLLWCESQLNPSAKGDFRIETGENMAYGPAQWWSTSFINSAKKYNYQGRRSDPFANIELAAITIAHEGAHQWTNCNKVAGFPQYGNNS